jgi:hypothetical protein
VTTAPKLGGKKREGERKQEKEERKGATEKKIQINRYDQMETTMQAVAPTVAAGWGGMLGGWVGGSYQRVRRFIADHRKGTYAAHYIVVFDVYKSITNTIYVQGCCAWR